MTTLSSSTVNKINQVGSVFSVVTGKELTTEEVVTLLVDNYLQKFQSATDFTEKKSAKAAAPVKKSVKRVPRGTWSKFNWEALAESETPRTFVIGSQIPKGSVAGFKHTAYKTGAKLGKSVSVKQNGTRSITVQFKSR